MFKTMQTVGEKIPRAPFESAPARRISAPITDYLVRSVCSLSEELHYQQSQRILYSTAGDKFDAGQLVGLAKAVVVWVLLLPLGAVWSLALTSPTLTPQVVCVVSGILTLSIGLDVLDLETDHAPQAL